MSLFSPARDWDAVVNRDENRFCEEKGLGVERVLSIELECPLFDFLPRVLRSDDTCQEHRC